MAIIKSGMSIVANMVCVRRVRCVRCGSRVRAWGGGAVHGDLTPVERLGFHLVDLWSGSYFPRTCGADISAPHVQLYGSPFC